MSPGLSDLESGGLAEGDTGLFRERLPPLSHNRASVPALEGPLLSSHPAGVQLALLTPGKLPEISERRWELGAGGQGSATGEQEESRGDPGTRTGKSGRRANPGHVAPEFLLLRAPNLWTWATLWRKGSQLCLLFTS